jgi:hypothetical protein
MKFKIGDKVTIKDIDAVLKENFGHEGRDDVSNYILISLNNLKKNYGTILTARHNECYISDYGGTENWYINTKLLFHYKDHSLPEDLFKI